MKKCLPAPKPAPKPASVSFAIALWSMFNPAHVAHAADPIELDPIQITATRKPERSFDVSQPVTTVNQAQIQERNPQVMTEALRGEAGVFFQQTGAGQGIAIVRGLKGSEVLHLVDGFRLNNAFFRTAPSQYIALLDPYNIQKIEVLRGPYATLYGPDAMGGVVSVQTEETRFKGQALQSCSHVFLHAGSHDQSRNARVTQAVGNQTVSVQAGYTYQDYGSREVGGVGQVADGRGNITLDERIGPTAYTARAYDAKVLWAISPVDELSVAYQHYGVPSLPRYNEVVPGSKPITPAGSAVENPARAVSIYDNSRDFYHLRYRHSAPLAFIDTLEVHVGRQVIDDDRYDLRRNLTRQEFEQNRSTLDGLTVNALSTAGAHRLTYGIELYQDRIDSSKQRQDGAGARINTSAATAFKSRFPNGAQTDNYGAYLNDTWLITERLRVDMGGRYNVVNTRLPAAPTSDRANGGDIDNHDYTGQIGLRYAVLPSLAYTLNAGHGFRAPNLNDLAAVGDRSNNRVVVANPDLQPESVDSVDTGFKYRAGGLSAEATVFYMKYQDRITLIDNPAPVANGQLDCTNTAGCAQSQNIARATYYGFESAVRWQVIPTVKLFANLNLTRATQERNGVKEDGNRIPPINSLIGLDWKVRPHIEIEPSLWINGEQRRLDATDRNDNRIGGGTGGFVVANLLTRWQPDPLWQVQIGLDNLLDKAYREHGSGVDGRGRGIHASVATTF